MANSVSSRNSSVLAGCSESYQSRVFYSPALMACSKRCMENMKLTRIPLGLVISWLRNILWSTLQGVVDVSLVKNKLTGHGADSSKIMFYWLLYLNNLKFTCIL